MQLARGRARRPRGARPRAVCHRPRLTSAALHLSARLASPAPGDSASCKPARRRAAAPADRAARPTPPWTTVPTWSTRLRRPNPLPPSPRARRLAGAGAALGVWAWWAAKEGAYFGVVLLPGAILLCVGAALLAALRALARASCGSRRRWSSRWARSRRSACWALLSALWSPAPDVAVADGQRILVYALAFGARPRPLQPARRRGWSSRSCRSPSPAPSPG